MKIIVRALVFGMLLTGFAANHMLAAKTPATNGKTMIASTSAIPAPSCEPGTTCGMDQ
jgi:hypothetical protein